MPFIDLNKTTKIIGYLEKKDLTISEAEDIIEFLQNFINLENTKVTINKIIYGGKQNGICDKK